MAKLSRVIFFVYLILLLIGVLFVLNSSVVDAFREFGNQWTYLSRQLVWIVFSLIAYIYISRLSPKKIFHYSAFAYWYVIALLIMVLIPGLGQQIQGARRWLNIGFFSLQPSEFIKGVLVLYLPYLIHVKKILPKQFLYIGFIPVGLILIQPDLGTAIIVGILVIGLYLLSSFSPKDLITYLPIGLLLIFIYISSSSYRMDRIKAFFSNNSYQSHQSLIAIGQGGIFGIGFGQSRQKYNFLPESSTDSIFSILAEETGLIGSTILLSLYVILITVCFRIAANTTNPLHSHTATGIGMLISFQTLLNLGAITRMLPLTGVPLPFISYGGSSLLNFSCCLAVITAISKND